MIRNFDDMIARAAAMPVKKTVSIANGADEKLLHLADELIRRDLCRIIISGDAAKIRAMAAELGADLSAAEIIDEPDEQQAALRAVEAVSSGRAQVYVKGMMNTSDFLRSVLNKEVGLRTGDKLSVLTCYDVPGQKKLFFLSDGGMTVLPTLEEKAAILRNSVQILNNMGIEEPKVAILSSNEKVSEKIPSTVDAKALCDMAAEGKLPKGIYEGPIAFDVAMRPEAAREKKIESRVSGDVDLFLVPNIETGNCMGKAIGYFGGGDTAGIVTGAASPVVMSSRSASLKGKLASVAWALLACGNKEEKEG